jgi:formate/nitrite transporter FocA (FNT family)
MDLQCTITFRNQHLFGQNNVLMFNARFCKNILIVVECYLHSWMLRLTRNFIGKILKSTFFSVDPNDKCNFQT